jgi:hypothetical protein
MIKITDTTQLVSILSVVMFFVFSCLGLIISFSPIKEQVFSKYTDLQADLRYILTQEKLMNQSADN